MKSEGIKFGGDIEQVHSWLPLLDTIHSIQIPLRPTQKKMNAQLARKCIQQYRV
jgi:hypothetical protein